MVEAVDVEVDSDVVLEGGGKVVDEDMNDDVTDGVWVV